MTVPENSCGVWIWGKPSGSGKEIPMNLVFASDSFKGSLSSQTIARILTEEAQLAFPGCGTASVPVADGGEGTLDAVLSALGGTRRKVDISGPLFEPAQGEYGLLENHTALIELAQAAGLTLVPPSRRDPRYTTTYGVGELILDALEQGCTTIYLALGGSATNDGGIGAMSALGVRFLDDRGRELSGVGADLTQVRHIDRSGLHPAVARTKFIVMSDVTNPLLGRQGATYTFGPQKGAEEPVLQELESGMDRYARLVSQTTGVSVATVPGGGAAGGMGAACLAFLGAEIRSGIQTVLDLAGFDALLAQADLVVTGEGRLDGQSVQGKAVSGIAHRCQKRGVPVLAIAGSLGEGYEALLSQGISGIMTLPDRPMPEELAMEEAQELYRNAARRAFLLLKLGQRLQGRD